MRTGWSPWSQPSSRPSPPTHQVDTAHPPPFLPPSHLVVPQHLAGELEHALAPLVQLQHRAEVRERCAVLVRVLHRHDGVAVVHVQRRHIGPFGPAADRQRDLLATAIAVAVHRVHRACTTVEAEQCLHGQSLICVGLIGADVAAAVGRAHRPWSPRPRRMRSVIGACGEAPRTSSCMVSHGMASLVICMVWRDVVGG
eukprot:364267-Chlamydomonas_euryale.AAC.9